MSSPIIISCNMRLSIKIRIFMSIFSKNSKTQKRVLFMAELYDNFRRACAVRGTTISQVLDAIGKASGSTGTWKSGKFPRLDTVMLIAEHLGISLDELCYGFDKMSAKILSENDKEWLALLYRIPKDRRQMCKDFLLTHAALPPDDDEEA